MKDNSTAQLERCPFCGGHACLFQDDGDRFVECSECGNRTPLMISRAAAIAKWNTRAPVSQDAAQLVERLLEELDGWEQAYPLSAFPEPDLKMAAALLKAGGMTLDAVSASNIRHVVSRLAPRVRETIEALTRVQPSTGLDMGALSGSRASAEPVSRLGPTGFDPARWTVESVAVSGLQRGWKVCRDGKPISFLFDDREDAERAVHEFRAEAIATEARRAETTGSACEGAGGEAVSPKTPHGDSTK